MPKRDVQRPEWKLWQIILFVLVVIAFAWRAVLTLIAGRTHYQSWWGGAVFAPFVLVIVLLLLVGLFRMKR
jgi:uncharacterized membrane protein